jgi:prolyl-tRNA synthetase
MRVSQMLLVTLRDDPAEAEIPSHKLLLRAGYIRRISSGIYAYLPMLWRVLRKISAIVREELDATGALETLLPQLQPSELWERSGRWVGYTAGEGIMFHLEDRQGRSLGLGPTHEEVITALAADLLRSYRQLPVNLYQIQTKFRDEIRPRFGLMRGREFIMKDGYSFHADEECLRRTYAAMDGAYRRIFARCGLRAVAVEADSGAIGGSASQEFMVTAEAGEDLILASPDGRYAANQERAISLPPEAVPLALAGPTDLETPGQSSIEALVSAHGLDPTQIVKVLLLLARFADGPARVLLVSLRGDQQLNEVKLANAVSARCREAGALLEIAPLSAEQVAAQGLELDISRIPFGYVGPDLNDELLKSSPLRSMHFTLVDDSETGRQSISAAHNTGIPFDIVSPETSPANVGISAGGKKTTAIHVPGFLRLADPTALALERFVCGANRPDHHRVGVAWSDLGGAPEGVDLRAAQPGDRCLHDPAQALEAARGIEVGHIFQLGRKYSEALDARFTNESGQEEALWMGCYGIGVSRLAQAAVEQHHDADGIRWPLSIAPYEVIVVIASAQDPQQVALAERLYNDLGAAGVDVLLDDRAERAGVKFKDSDLIGIPWRLVVGRGAAAGQVELVERCDPASRRDMAADAAVALLQEQLPRQRQGLGAGG